MKVLHFLKKIIGYRSSIGVPENDEIHLKIAVIESFFSKVTDSFIENRLQHGDFHGNIPFSR